MAITGQFGRVITGGSSMASSIANIASDFASLRISRIYEAFLNGGSFEGAPMDAQRAISLLSGMMSEFGDNGRIALDIEQTLTAVRKANRTRILNDLDAKLEAEGSLGDWSNKVSVIEDMLLDPTLTPDELSDLQVELSDAIDDVLVNAQNEFAAGGKITVNGTTIDFASGANEDQFLALFDGFIEKYPAMEQKIGREKDLALSTIAVSKASQFWLDTKRTTDQQKLEGYNGQLELLKNAYKALQESPYGLATSPQAISILQSIRDIQGYKETVKDNISQAAASKRLEGAAKSVFGDFDLLDKAMKKNPIIAGMLGEYSIVSFLQGSQRDINDGLQIIDKFKYLNGGSTVTIGGKTIDFSRDNIYNMSRDAQVAARSLNEWAKDNEFVSSDWKKAIAGYLTSTNGMVKNNPEVRLEDAYDTAIGDFKASLANASLNASQRKQLAIDFGNTLMGLMDRFKGKVEQSVLDTLGNEADMYRFGKELGPMDYTFGETSGNYPQYDSNGNRILTTGTDEIAALMNPSAQGKTVSLMEAIRTNNVEVDLWNRGQGQYFTDGWSGTRTQVILGEDTSAWQNGSGMTLRSSTEISVGGAQIPSSRKDTYARVRLMLPGWENDTSNKGIEKYTAGWITPVLGMDGTTEWVLTKRNGQNEQFISAAAVDSIIDAMGGNPNALLTPVGSDGNYVIPITGAAKEIFDANGVGDYVPRSLITTGGNELDTVMRTAGYTIVDTVDIAQKSAIDSLIVSGDIRVENGKIVVVDKTAINDPTMGYGDRSTTDITNLIPRNVASQIVIANNDTTLDRDGNGLPDFPGERGTQTQTNVPYTERTSTPQAPTAGYGAAQFAPPPPKPKQTFTPQEVSKSIVDFRASERASAAPARTVVGSQGPRYDSTAPVSSGSPLLNTFMRNLPTVTGTAPTRTAPPVRTNPPVRTIQPVPPRTPAAPPPRLAPPRNPGAGPIAQ